MVTGTNFPRTTQSQTDEGRRLLGTNSFHLQLFSKPKPKVLIQAAQKGRGGYRVYTLDQIYPSFHSESMLAGWPISTPQKLHSSAIFRIMWYPPSAPTATQPLYFQTHRLRSPLLLGSFLERHGKAKGPEGPSPRKGKCQEGRRFLH